MLALLIKPAAMAKAKHRAIVSRLIDDGALILEKHSIAELRNEVSSLKARFPDLTVVACGGDGTVNLALNAIVDLGVQLAVLPMGTGNDFARHIGIRKIETGLEALESKNKISMDIGRISFPDNSQKYFAAVASCGFDAQVNERANTISGPNGPLKYLVSVIGEIKALNSVNLHLNTDGKSIEGNFTLVAIGNTSSYGGGMKITPAADMQDGLFSLTIVDRVARRTLLKVLPKVFWGAHVFHPKVSVDQARRIEISGESFPIYADGEKMGVGPAVFEVLPACLRILIPNTP